MKKKKTSKIKQLEEMIPLYPNAASYYAIAFRLGLLKPGKITNKKIKKALNKIRLYAAILTIKRKDLTEIKLPLQTKTEANLCANNWEPTKNEIVGYLSYIRISKEQLSKNEENEK